jgi:hypothetical protein
MLDFGGGGCDEGIPCFSKKMDVRTPAKAQKPTVILD